MMPVRLLLLILLSLISIRSAFASETGPTPHAQRLERELFFAMDQALRDGGDINVASLTKLESEANAANAQWAGRGSRLEESAKLLQLRGPLANARRYNELRAQGRLAKLPYSDLSPGIAVSASEPNSHGTNCQNPWDLTLGVALQTSLATAGLAGDGFWVRIATPAEGTIALSTLGSIGDVDISVYADCSDSKPLLSNDDYYGLQALLALSRDKRATYLARVGNRDVQSPVTARIEAMLATGFNGTVSIDPAGGASAAGMNVAHFTSQSSYYVGSVLTDAAGKYDIVVNSAGTYFARTGSTSGAVSVIHEAYGDVSCSNSDYYTLNGCGPAPLAPITVLANQSTHSIDMNLSLARSLSFRLVDQNTGAPLIGATANLSDGGYARSAQTDGAGRASFVGLRPGIGYQSSFQAEGFRPELFDDIPCTGYCQLSLGTPIVFQSNDPYFRELTVQLMPTRKLTVYVRELAQTNSATVRLLFPSGQTAVSGSAYYSNIPGWRSATFTDPPVGSYYLQAGFEGSSFWRLHPNVDCLSDCATQFGQAQLINIDAAVTTEEIYIEPRAFPSVDGSVVDRISGNAINSATAHLIPLDNSYPALVSVTMGTYRFPYVRPGQYLIAVTSNQYVDVAYPNAPCSYSNYSPQCPNATPINITSTANSFSFDFELNRSGRIEGELSIEGALITGYSTIQMRLRRPDNSTSAGVLERTANQYSFSDISAGDYRVLVEDSGIAYGQIYPGIHCAANACQSSQLGEILNVGESPLSNIDFSLRLQRGGKGRVVDMATGLPIAGAVVDMWSSSSFGSNYYELSGLTNSDGRFVLPARSGTNGEYLLATSVGSNYINEVYNNVLCPLGPAYFNLCDLRQGNTVSGLYPIDSQGITFRLAPNDGDSLFADGMED